MKFASSKLISAKNSFVLIFFLSIILTSAVVCIAIIGATPPHSRDALIHHLYVPKLWLQNHSIDPLQSIVFSYYPMNLDLLYMIPLSFGNDIFPKYIHFAFALLTALLIYQYLKPRLSQTWALFGSVFFLSLPIIIKLSVTVYVDLGIVFFSTASLLSLFRWAESSLSRYFILAAVCCGLAAGTKYNALISIFLLTLLTPLVYVRLGQPATRIPSIRGVIYAAVFLLITLLVYSPWLARNYLATGNPIYPLHHSIIKKFKNQVTTGESEQTISVKEIGSAGKKVLSRRSSNLALRKVRYGETWPQILLLPVRFFFEGQDDDPRYFDGKLNPFLLIFMLFSFYHFRYSDQVRKEQWFLLAFGWLFFFFTFFQEALRIRYIATSLPAFVILATFGLHNISARLNQIEAIKAKTAQFVIALLGTAAIAYNGLYLIDQFRYYNPLEYISGQVSRDEYLGRYLIDYPVQKYAAEHLDGDSRILAIYVGQRGYYFEFPVRFDPIKNKSILGRMIRNAENSTDIYHQLVADGFTHLFIRFDLFNRAAGNNLTIEEVNRFNHFLDQHATQLADNAAHGQSYVLFELHP